jgi:hypothetical protein
MARPEIWAGYEAQGGSIPAVGLRPTSNEASGPKIGRSHRISTLLFFAFSLLVPRSNAAANIYEMACTHSPGNLPLFTLNY